MVSGNSFSRRGRDTREIRIETRQRLASNFSGIFQDEHIRILQKRRKKAEKKIANLKIRKEDIESKDLIEKENEKYDNVKKQLYIKEKELEDLKNELSDGITLYQSIPLRIVLRSNEIAVDLVKENIDKEKILERINKNIEFPSEKVKENFINTTYNLTLDLVENIKRYKIKRNNIDEKFENKNSLLNEMENMTSNLTELTIKGLEIVITIGSLFGLSSIKRIHTFISELNPNEIIFYIIPTAFAINKFIDKIKNYGIKMYKKIITKKKEKKASELREELRENKRKIFNSLYAEVSENVYICLNEIIHKLKKKNIIDEKEFQHYQELINKNKINDKSIIEEKAKIIEKEL
jgi:hypothetical protein